MIKPPGRRLADLDEDGIRPLRLAGIALAPQGSMNSLNPVLRIGRQIADAFADHGLRLGRYEEERRVAALAARAPWLPALLLRPASIAPSGTAPLPMCNTGTIRNCPPVIPATCCRYSVSRRQPRAWVTEPVQMAEI